MENITLALAVGSQQSQIWNLSTRRLCTRRKRSWMHCSREVYRTVKVKILWIDLRSGRDISKEVKVYEHITLDECFQFGLGAFETIGIEQETPIFLEKHLKRLERAADFLKLGAYRKCVGSQPGKIEEYLKEQKKRPEVQKEFGRLEHCALKLMLTKGKCIVFS